MKDLIESDKSSEEIVQSLTEKESFSNTFTLSELEQGLKSWLQKIFTGSEAITIASDMYKDLEYEATRDRGNNSGKFGIGMVDGEEWVVNFDVIEGSNEPEIDITVSQGRSH